MSIPEYTNKIEAKPAPSTSSPSLFRGADPAAFDAAVESFRQRELTSIKIPGRFTVVLGGDILQTAPVAQLADPSVQAVFDIVRSADVANANMESNIRDDNPDDPSSNVNGLQGPREIAADVRAQGWHILLRAGNHAMDPSPDLLLETNRLLRQAGVETVGSGRNLQEARAARFVSTPKGRVGVVGTFASPVSGRSGPLHPYTSETDSLGSIAASYQIGFSGGRTGVNPTRMTEYHLVSPAELEQLRAVAQQNAAYRRAHGGTAPVIPTQPGSPVQLNGAWYRARRKGEHSVSSFTMYPEDLQQNLRSVRNGKEQSDFMIMNIHAHASTGVGGVLEAPPDFLIEYAHLAVENGADAVAITGPHQLRGIEVYRGRPIFYGLCEVVFSIMNTPAGLGRYFYNDLDQFRTEFTDMELNWVAWTPLGITLLKDRMNMPAAESVLPRITYQDGRLAQIELTPIHLGYGAPISQLGIPHVATGPIAQRILTRLQQLSQPFGTTITIHNDTGLIQMQSSELL